MSEPVQQNAGTAVTMTLLGVTSLTMMSGASIAPALPGIRDFFADTPGVEMLTRLLLTVPALAIALTAPGAGWFLDRFGRRRILLGAIAMYGAAGTAGVCLDSLVAIIASRAVLGITVAATTTAATTLVGDYFEGSERNRVLGLQAATAAAAGVVMLLAGGALAEITWRAPFVMYSAALFLLPVVALVIREPPRAEHGRGGGDGRRVAARVVAQVAAIYGTAFLVQVAAYMVPVQLPFYLGELGEPDPSRAGMALSTLTLFAAVVASQFRRIHQRLDRTVILCVSLGTLGVGFLLVSRAGSYAAVVVSMIVMGLAMGLNFPNLMGWLMARTPAHARGRVVGGLSTSMFLGQFFSPIATHPFISRGGFAYGYRMMGVVLAVAATAAAFAALVKPFQRRRSRGA
jgi:MFS family permease